MRRKNRRGGWALVFMLRSFAPAAVFLALAALFLTVAKCEADTSAGQEIKVAVDNKELGAMEIKLQKPVLDAMLGEVLETRRSLRSYSKRTLAKEEIGAILWAVQGITNPEDGGRTAPSAGATYPLNVYALTQDGVFRYRPEKHALKRVMTDDRRPELCDAALGQRPVKTAPLVLLITGTPERIIRRYGERSQKYMDIESGHVGQNALLAAEALGLGGVPIGAFYEDKISRAIGLPDEEIPLYILAIGSR